jgi:quercetin dioxygenase-like cupin family protein
VTASELQVIARRPNEGEAHWILGGLYSFRALSAETGAYFLVEVVGPQGLAAPLHIHPDEDEGFYVTRGTVRLVIGDRTIEASAGSFLLAPRGARHAFVFASPDARLLLLVSPGSAHEDLFRAIGEPASRREIPPPPAGPPDFERLAATAVRHGTQIIGPPPI